ncbi:hypothetical protein B7494_g5562 [Chlorociboria aeruginascens]|nr:hypothetical protein B7494_g5562 [Chlorociboria aeruginascens]
MQPLHLRVQHVNFSFVNSQPHATITTSRPHDLTTQRPNDPHLPTATYYPRRDLTSMKETSPDSTSYIDSIRSWARTKAYGLSSLSKDSSRSPTLPLSNAPSTTTTQQIRPAQDDTNYVPPFASPALPGPSQPANPTSNIVADNTSSEHPPPAPPPEADGQGTVVETEPPKKKNVARRFYLTSKHIILSSYVNILLVFVPVGIAAKAAGLSPGIVFAMNAIAIVPLAGLLSHATESVAKRMGDTVGALMNVTFGNAVELIILWVTPRYLYTTPLTSPSIIALSKNEIRIVQASLLGSILANLLLILGMCFLIGGLRYREQIYNSTITQMSACLLSLSVMSLLLPTAFHASFNTTAQDQASKNVLKVSRGTSVVLLIVYGMYLLFQLKSHAFMYQSTPQYLIDKESAPGPVAQWMESSDSDDSDDSSSSSDSDTSDGSHNTAKRIKRAIIGRRRRRKSSAGSENIADIDPLRTPSLGTNSISPVNTDLFDEGLVGGHRLGAIDAGEEGDDEHFGRSRNNSIIERAISKKQRKKEKKRRAKQRKRDRKNRHKDAIEEVTSNNLNEKSEVPEDPNATRHIDFAIESPIDIDASIKRPFNLRAITQGIRPQIPKTFSQNVFSANATPVATPAMPSGPIPRVRYGIRRTNSLPDRLNQQHMGPTSVATNLQPVRINNTAAAANKDPKDEENISRTTAVMLLLISTGLVALCAEFLVGSINAVVSGNSGLSEAFVGLIILPIVGNAAEHVTAVTVALKNKMDLAVGIAVGSSIQIALFVTPFIVLLGWCMDKEMTLYFTLFETVCLFVSAFIVNFLVLDGRTNYLEGALLIAAYVIIAVAAFFYPQVDNQSNLGGNADAANKMIRDLLDVFFLFGVDLSIDRQFSQFRSFVGSNLLSLTLIRQLHDVVGWNYEGAFKDEWKWAMVM